MSTLIAERRGPDRVGVAHVLLAEDSSTTRRILRELLETAGYRVTEAADGAQALALCASERPDLVLLDLDMPVMDGRAFLVALRAHDELADLPVVVLTTETSASMVAQTFAMGAQDYVRKSCPDDELKARINGVLARHRHERALRARISHVDRLSAIDDLTGLGNRRAFERYRERMALAGRDHRPVGLVILDVDHFKRINDTEGHVVGDAVLRILARRLEGALDPGQLLVRWGGEELVVVAPGLNAAGARALGEQLHDVVGATPCALEEHSIDVTVSVGCTSGPLSDGDALVRIADEAMYEAKRSGRDRVVAR